VPGTRCLRPAGVLACGAYRSRRRCGRRAHLACGRLRRLGPASLVRALQAARRHAHRLVRGPGFARLLEGLRGGRGSSPAPWSWRRPWPSSQLAGAGRLDVRQTTRCRARGVNRCDDATALAEARERSRCSRGIRTRPRSRRQPRPSSLKGGAPRERPLSLRRAGAGLAVAACAAAAFGSPTGDSWGADRTGCGTYEYLAEGFLAATPTCRWRPRRTAAPEDPYDRGERPYRLWTRASTRQVLPVFGRRRSS